MQTKVTVCLVLCALMATAYTAPAPARTQAWWQLIGKGLSHLIPDEERAINQGWKSLVDADMQDDDDDDDMAQIEALLQDLQNEVELQSFWNKVKNFGKKALAIGKKYGPAAKKAYDIYNGGVNIQDDNDDDDRAQIEALLQSLHENAEEEGWKDWLRTGLSIVGKKK